MQEGDIILPRNPYSASKAVGSLLRVTYDNTYSNLAGKTVETRFCNVFGPRQTDQKIMPKIKRSLQSGESIPVHNEGVGYREYIYIKNIPPAIEIILEKGDGVYNLTLGDGYTVKDLIGKAEQVTGKSVPTHPAHRPGMDMRYEMDPSRIKELGYKPLYTFEEGLKEYLEQPLEVPVAKNMRESGSVWKRARRFAKGQ